MYTKQGKIGEIYIERGEEKKKETKEPTIGRHVTPP
jgi:hypothetical protein